MDPKVREVLAFQSPFSPELKSPHVIGRPDCFHPLGNGEGDLNGCGARRAEGAGGIGINGTRLGGEEGGCGGTGSADWLAREAAPWWHEYSAADSSSGAVALPRLQPSRGPGREARPKSKGYARSGRDGTTSY